MTRRILWNGTPLPFAPGETIAQALARAGVLTLGSSRAGQPHAVFCGIGQCQNCLVLLDGVTPREACLTLCRDGQEVRAITGGDHA